MAWNMGVLCSCVPPPGTVLSNIDAAAPDVPAAGKDFAAAFKFGLALRVSGEVGVCAAVLVCVCVCVCLVFG